MVVSHHLKMALSWATSLIIRVSPFDSCDGDGVGPANGVGGGRGVSDLVLVTSMRLFVTPDCLIRIIGEGIQNELRASPQPGCLFLVKWL